ncbi:MAG TPA: nickel pincer cofactor biosynthesis protein LarC [Syntrophomonas sp.]|nr:nickel pincer cofactor biosynthesis protein LarC [Syntrophomonas sp.]HRW12260.1 nickel pincer cofactor biosynthesis protein LarC [Syntrophomonas sp.]
MHFVYLDCFSGISGDMLIGALLDGGASLTALQEGIEALNLGARLAAAKQVRQGISCTTFRVDCPDAPPLRHLEQIEAILQTSSLPEAIKKDSLAVFRRLAQAEAEVHGIDMSRVHFHEIGAVDTIVDVVGTFLCLADLGAEQVYASALPWANGVLDMSHGRYPLPAPAVVRLLQGYPCVSSAAGIELVTPTGAALLTHLVKNQAAPNAFVPLAVGYGAGSREREDKVPNLLRMIRAQADERLGQRETIAVLETEVDDLNPEIFTHLYRLCLDHPGVMDFFTTPVYMKKNRPGTLITVLTARTAADEICRLLMRETGTLGVRYRFQERFAWPRHQELLSTPWGQVRIKVARADDGTVYKKAEFEDCQAIARQNQLSLREVFAVVQNRLNDIPD